MAAFGDETREAGGDSRTDSIFRYVEATGIPACLQSTAQPCLRSPPLLKFFNSPAKSLDLVLEIPRHGRKIVQLLVCRHALDVGETALQIVNPESSELETVKMKVAIPARSTSPAINPPNVIRELIRDASPLDSVARRSASSALLAAFSALSLTLEMELRMGTLTPIPLLGLAALSMNSRISQYSFLSSGGRPKSLVS